MVQTYGVGKASVHSILRKHSAKFFGLDVEWAKLQGQEWESPV